MQETPKRRGRPFKSGQRVKSVSISLLPNRINDLDSLVAELEHESRGSLVTHWIERELKAVERKGRAA